MLLKLLDFFPDIAVLPEQRREGVFKGRNPLPAKSRSTETGRVETAYGVRPVHNAKRWDVTARPGQPAQECQRTDAHKLVNHTVA